MTKRDMVVIDIDGCLNQYPSPLKMWAEMTLHLDAPAAKEAIKVGNDFSLLKDTYRHSRILSYLLPRKGVTEVLENIKKNGYRITLLTARNPKKNRDIETITVRWLNKYHIPFDSIIFSKDKSGYIQQHTDQIMMVVEDEPKFLDLFETSGTEVVAFSNDINGGITRPHFHMVSSWEEIDHLFEQIMKK